ncbi:MAG: ABC transporter ATP-binding protein [Chloroflexi bacterium]|nr:MAG: ABC transporter ATP-binding protein [Chloroflexota bacterium]
MPARVRGRRARLVGGGPVIEVQGLGKRFGALEAVQNLSFTVGDGEIFGLLGPNGAGKTTTVRMLAGLVVPSAGAARINGLRLGPDSRRIRAISGILTEAPGLHDKLTARQNLGYYGRLYGLTGATLRRAVDHYLGVVELSEMGDRRVAGFSKGMRQKVAIARALLHEPEVIYLDEPTSALDPSAAKNIRDFVSVLRDAGRSIVICTHNLDEAERLCDRIGIIRQTLIQVNSPAALRRYGRLATVHVQLAASDGEARRLLDALVPLPFVMGAREHEGTLQVEVRDPRRDNPELVATLVAHGARIVGVREEAATLEDVYLQMVGEIDGKDAA